MVAVVWDAACLFDPCDESQMALIETLTIDVNDAFDLIRDECWRGDRPLVPLFGAGISVDAGIPAATGLKRYLERLALYLDICDGSGHSSPGEPPSRQMIRSAKCREWLQKFGWPDYHELNNLVINASAGHSLAHIDRNAQSRLETIGALKWWELLNYLTHGDAALKDLLFDRLVCHAQPAACHHYAAFLAAAMDWRVVLTTNFDTLLETAFRAHGLSATVYPLPESHELPDAKLIAANRAIIKMHGTAFGLLAGAIVDVPLDHKRQQTFLEYLPRDPLLMIVGYGGGDIRVMHMLDAFCRTAPHGPDVRILWVARDLDFSGDSLKHFARIPGLKLLQYRDGGAFLQELHNRLTTSYAVTTSWYRALSEVPPRVTHGTELQEHFDEPVVVFWRHSDAYGTSSALARHVKRLSKRGFDVLWCHLEHLPTVDSLIAHLQQEFRKRDALLPPFAMFRGPGSTAAADPTGFADNDPRLQWIVDAMQRGRYVVAFDSVGEFGQPLFSAGKSEMSATNGGGRDEAPERVLSFLDVLISHAGMYGDSRIAVSWSPFESGKSSWSVRARVIQLPGNSVSTGTSGVQHVPVAGLVATDDPPVLLSLSDKTTESSLEVMFDGRKAVSDAMSKLSDLLDGQVPRLSRQFISHDLIPQLWQLPLSHLTRILLIVSATFRRSRSIIALRTIVLPLLDISDRLGLEPAERAGAGDSFWSTLTRALEILEMNSDPRSETGSSIKEARADYRATSVSQRNKLDKVINALNDIRVLVHQEGGFIWMHRVVVEAMRHTVFSKTSPAMLDSRARLESIIALHYYEQVFSASHDRAAFVEYLRHRGASLQAGTQDELVTRLRHLDAVLKIERDQILSQRQADTVLGYVDELKHNAVEAAVAAVPRRHPKYEEAQYLRRELRATLCDLRAEVLRQKSDFLRCISQRCEQIADKLMDARRKKYEAQWRACGVDLELAVQAFERKNRSNASDASPFTKEVGRCLQAVFKLLARTLPLTKGLCLSNNTPSDGVSGFRIAEHAIDIAACLTGVSSKRGVAATCGDMAHEILNQVHDVLLNLQRELSSVPLAARPTLQMRVERGLVRCSFRLMEEALMPLTPWNLKDQEDAGARLRRALVWYDQGISYLRAFSGFEPRDYVHYRCFLNSLCARGTYLMASAGKGEYLRAYQLLATAQSSVSPPLSGSERAALAVCRLHRAELLMLDADSVCNTVDSSSGSESPPRLVHTYLRQVQEEIEHARQLMYGARPHVSWWTWLYLLSAQYEHENALLVLCFKRSGGPSVDEHIRLGLKALRIGLQCARQSPIRESGLRCLLWQFAVLHAVVAIRRHEDAQPARLHMQWKELVAHELRELSAVQWLTNAYSSHKRLMKYLCAPELAQALRSERLTADSLRQTLLRVEECWIKSLDHPKNMSSNSN
jgi:hypothetical protein